jgi:hypothetical protein
MSEDLGIQGRGTFLPRGRHDPRAASCCRRSRLACDCGGTPCVATPHCSRAMTPLRHRRRSLSRSSSIRREPGDPLQRSISSAEIAGGVTPRRRNPRHAEIFWASERLARSGLLGIRRQAIAPILDSPATRIRALRVRLKLLVWSETRIDVRAGATGCRASRHARQTRNASPRAACRQTPICREN